VDGVAVSDLNDGSPHAAVVGDTPLLLLRHDGHLHAMHDRCSHRGCKLTELGEVDGEIITCNCHGSQFHLHDGSVQRGPATAFQPVYEARERDGRVEVRMSAD
jgi:nitrite reductase/ring-hydroxylating ferredoxin subunit